MCIDDEAAEKIFQGNGRRGCVFFGFVASLGSSICTRHPFSFTLRFYFIKFTALSTPLFCDLVRLSGFGAPITLISSSCVYYLYMDVTYISPCFLMPYLAVIWANVTSTASLCMSYIKYFSFLQFWWQIECHMFSLQTSFRGSQPLFLRWTFLDLCLCFHTP